MKRNREKLAILIEVSLYLFVNTDKKAARINPGSSSVRVLRSTCMLAMLLQGFVENLCYEEEPKHPAIFTYKLLDNYFSHAFKRSFNRDFHSYINTRSRPDFILCQVRAEGWNGSKNARQKIVRKMS